MTDDLDIEEYLRDLRGELRERVEEAATAFRNRLVPRLWQEYGTMKANTKVIPPQIGGEDNNTIQAIVHVPDPSQFLELGTDIHHADPRIRREGAAFESEAIRIISGG